MPAKPKPIPTYKYIVTDQDGESFEVWTGSTDHAEIVGTVALHHRMPLSAFTVRKATP
jgi:hypothetical protein